MQTILNFLKDVLTINVSFILNVIMVSKEKTNYKKLYTVLSCLGVFTFCTCCKILICLVYFVASFKLSFV